MVSVLGAGDKYATQSFVQNSSVKEMNSNRNIVLAVGRVLHRQGEILLEMNNIISPNMRGDSFSDTAS
jgi:hypothetical protein